MPAAVDPARPMASRVLIVRLRNDLPATTPHRLNLSAGEHPRCQMPIEGDFRGGEPSH
jgi:hypothetical protein